MHVKGFFVMLGVADDGRPLFLYPPVHKAKRFCFATADDAMVALASVKANGCPDARIVPQCEREPNVLPDATLDYDGLEFTQTAEE